MLSAIDGRQLMTHRVLSEPPAIVRGKFEYATANYVIAGYIIDTVTNTAFEEVASVRLFEPLGMSSAGFGPVPESSNTSIDNPWPHTMAFPSPIPNSLALIYRDNPPAIASAGGAYSSLSDYAKFLRLHLDGVRGRINATSPFNLSTTGFQHLHTAYPDNDKQNSYTYGGWFRSDITDSSNEYILSHDGSNTYYFVTAEIHTKLNTAYMAMTNVANGTPEESFGPAIHNVTQGIVNGAILHYWWRAWLSNLGFIKWFYLFSNISSGSEENHAFVSSLTSIFIGRFIDVSCECSMSRRKQSYILSQVRKKYHATIHLILFITSFVMARGSIPLMSLWRAQLW